MFKHPSYYKKLKASLKKEAISSDGSTDPEERAPESSSAKQQAEASSDKRQASKILDPKDQASSESPSNKR